ncbi:MAG: glycosyltransferase family 4 protein [Desulfoprunum sp.]|jgi:glycosyltransferase involved in cell wall biosynthesis|uniref:glycosyltransferase family 4 protein n=1 Tax=Desulfoprunum sp. TaxID=2020866 RepID=UPI00052C7AFD|nr:hypothetical protein JT06_10010 [Desulfobulbus sp. Tol-SR]
MNILHVISQHPESTGSGIYLQNLMRQAAAAGHRNFLVAGISADRAPHLEGISEDCCRVVRFSGGDLDFPIPGMSDVMPYASSRFGALSSEAIMDYERAFAAVIGAAGRDFPIDIVHSHHLWLASAVARRVLPGLPLVVSCHSTDLRQFVQCPHLRGRVLDDCRRIDSILALSAGQAEQIAGLYGVDGKKIEVIGTGFDDRMFTFSDKPATGPVQLLYAGKLCHAKGVDWLLRVFARLGSQPVHLHLAGSGAGGEARECLDLAGGLARRVTVHGALSQIDLARLMQRCHVFVLPSFYEGVPLVLLEALASGCRIVTTNLPGCLELLDKVSCDLVEFVDLPPMATIDRPDPRHWGLLEDRLAMAVAAMIRRAEQSPTPSRDEVETITARSGWGVVFRKIAAVYERAGGGRGPG